MGIRQLRKDRKTVVVALAKADERISKIEAEIETIQELLDQRRLNQ